MAYVASTDTVSVINEATLAVVATIPVPGATLIAVDPLTNMIYVTTGSSVSVINGATNTVIATVAAGTSPLGVAVNPVTNTIYAVNNSSPSVSVINGATNTVTTTITLPGNTYYGFGVDVDPSTNSVYVADPPFISMINGTTNTVFASVITGQSGDTDTVAFDSASNTVYVPNYIGNVTNNVVVLPASLIQLYWADVDGDGVVNVFDIIQIGQHWLQTGPPGWIPADVNRDGVVNIQDIILIGEHWLQSTQ
jgi:YVTN family beta-propeller protein